VSVPANTPLAVQLEQGLVLSRRGLVARGPDAFTIYTAADRIRAAQQALAQQGYFRGTVNGQLDDATQRALFEYQIDKGIIATGNLDGRTARALGITTADAVSAAILSPDEASVVRRGAQALASRLRSDMGISSIGRLDARRAYAQGDLEAWFALSAFADNASLYEQLVRVSGNVDGSALAGKALISSAKRVDAALQQSRVSTQIGNAWSSIRAQLMELDPSYR
jgi:peptidoglycan hydrolase-like protein with peptidoglycan-binding domain